MTEFNPEKKETLTYGEALDPAMGITDQNDAQQYFKEYVSYLGRHLERKPRDDNMTAEEIARINLGYYAGYYDQETRKRVEELFGCAHPIFGRVQSSTGSAKSD